MDDAAFKMLVVERSEAREDGKRPILSPLSAIVTRRDDQDMPHDVLVGKVDRLAVNTGSVLETAVKALTRTTEIGRRVTRLERPDEGQV